MLDDSVCAGVCSLVSFLAHCASRESHRWVVLFLFSSPTVTAERYCSFAIDACYWMRRQPISLTLSSVLRSALMISGHC
jgi:hypothetical protein